MYDDMVCLREVLYEWIVGNHKHSKPPTLENLKKALNSKIVGLGITASQLDKVTLARHGISFTEPFLDFCGNDSLSGVAPSTIQLDIVAQQSGTEVAEEKSTLLEVQAVSTCGGTISHQWLKDGCPLKDNSEHYLGSNKSILCITASLATEGTYTCEVRSTSSESEEQTALAVSKPVVVTVSILHSKKVLVDMYHAQSYVHRDAWPPVGNRTYINLALVKQEGIDKGDFYSYATMQGDVDDVVCRKESVGYSKAFGMHKSGAFLLIEGRPGSGKTTLVHKVSEDWAKGTVLKGAKLMFLISLRMLSAKAIVKMADIMKKMFYINDNETGQSVLKQINSTNGKGVCFILDGLDEYKKQESVVFELIRKTYLPRSMVIVSSRPSGTFALRYRTNVYIEVIGFLKSQIQEYILSYPFTSRGSAQSLLLYLAQHPNVLHMCYLPVHIAMVSFLHDKIKGDLPSTECKMYQHFTNLTLLRKEGSRPPNSDVSLIKICKLAFQMTVSHRQFFIDEKELSLSDTKFNDDPSLGLVTIDHTAGLYGYHNLYTFVHLTFQEYLAAYHISKLGEQEQREVISKYGHMKHMRVVWKFYCGLVRFEDEDPKFAKVMELHKNHLFHCQCAFESQQPATCKSVILYNNSILRFSATHPVDFTCLGYVISNSSSPLESLSVAGISTGDGTAKLHACVDVLKQCGQLKVLDVKNNELGNEGAKILGDVLRQCNNLSELFLCSNRIGNKGARGLGDGLKQCSNLSELSLNDNKIGDKGAEGLGYGLSQCSNLSVISLTSNIIGDEGAKGLGDGLKQCSNLSELFLTNNKIGDEGAKGLSYGLRQCSKLSILSLTNNKISDEGAKGLGYGLRQCSNLSLLWLSFNRIGDEGTKGLVDGLRQCSNLSVLWLDGNKIGDEGAKSLGDGLRWCSNLSVLWLSCNIIGDEGAKGLGDGLRQCSSLSVLWLDGNKIGDVGAKGLGEDLRQCGNLSELWLDGNKIGDEGAKGLGDGLRQCTNLSELHLDNNEIGDEGAKGLGCVLRHCSNLSELHLDNNEIGDKGARGLGYDLRECSNLSVLSLSTNKIGDEGANGLGDGLGLFSRLSVLRLSSNTIGDKGARGLGDGLKQCTNLSELYLDYNKIGDEGAKGLGDGLMHCTNLSKLYLNYNNIGDEGAKCLADGLRQCGKLSELHLYSNKICFKCAKDLRDCLIHCVTVFEVDLNADASIGPLS